MNLLIWRHSNVQKPQFLSRHTVNRVAPQHAHKYTPACSNTDEASSLVDTDSYRTSNNQRTFPKGHPLELLRFLRVRGKQILFRKHATAADLHVVQGIKIHQAALVQDALLLPLRRLTGGWFGRDIRRRESAASRREQDAAPCRRERRAAQDRTTALKHDYACAERDSYFK